MEDFLFLIAESSITSGWIKADHEVECNLKGFAEFRDFGHAGEDVVLDVPVFGEVGETDSCCGGEIGVLPSARPHKSGEVILNGRDHVHAVFVVAFCHGVLPPLVVDGMIISEG